MKTHFYSLIAYWMLLSGFANENFESLKSLSESVRNQAIKSGWTLDDSAALPRGWSFLPGKNSIYKIVESGDPKKGKCIFVCGTLMTDYLSLARKEDDDTIEAHFSAKSASDDGKVTFLVSFGGDKGKYLRGAAKSVALTKEWKEYTVDIKLLKTVNGEDVKLVCPLIASPEGAYLDDISFSCLRKNSLPLLGKPVGKDLLEMDFELTGINGKPEFRDQTERYVLYSDCGLFREEHGALRASYGSRFRIPCGNNAFGDSFTISMWLLKSSLQYYFRTPVLSRGYARPSMRLNYKVNPEEYDFEIDLNSSVPGFKTAWGGIESTGWGGLGEYRYLNRSQEIYSPSKLLEMDKWTHLEAVYDKGRIRLYINGVLSAESNQAVSQPLLTSSLPLYLGGVRVKGETDNRESGEFLIRRLRVYKKAFDDRETAWEFASVPSGIDLSETYLLKPVRDYYPKEMLPSDPELAKRLSITEKYEKQKPSDPYAANKSMSGIITGDGQRTLNMLLNGHEISPISVNPTYWDGVPRRSEEVILDFAAAGVNLVKIGTTLRQAWTAPDKFDLTALEDLLDRTLRSNPAAAIYVTIALNPPAWFVRDYPEEMEEYYIDKNQPTLGKRKYTTSGPMASDQWLKMSCQIIRKIVQYLENSKYKNHIFGYAFSGGDSGEWYWPGQWSGAGTFTGYSNRTRESFRNFIQEKYKGDQALLRKSWNRQDITFETVDIPTPKERLSTENYQFRDPCKAGACLDMREFIQMRTFHCISETARAIKESLAVNKIVLTYYGYPLYYTWHSSILQVSGLQMTSDLLRSRYLDAIATPIDYFHRRGGESGTNIAGFTGTAYLNKKMLCCEQDLRTHLFPRLEHGRTSSLRETIEVIRRGYMYTIMDNYWFWFVFQAGNHCFHQEGIMTDIAKMTRLANDAVKRQRKDISEVALLFDEKDSLNMVSAFTKDEAEMMFMRDHTQVTFENAHQMGAPFKMYFTDDLANPKMPDFKLYVFLNQYSVSPEQMAIIDAKVKKNNAVAVWCYAPGYFIQRRNSLENMKKLTGFEFTEVRKQIHMSGKMDAVGKSPITENLKPLPEYLVGPVLEAKDKNASILAKWNGMNVIAMREFKNWRSVYTFVPLTREMLTGLCQYAGVHVYSTDGDTLLANDSYVAIHAASPGKKIIRLQGKALVRELIEGHDLGKTDQIEENIKLPWTTRIYELKYE